MRWDKTACLSAPRLLFLCEWVLWLLSDEQGGHVTCWRRVARVNNQLLNFKSIFRCYLLQLKCCLSCCKNPSEASEVRCGAVALFLITGMTWLLIRKKKTLCFLLHVTAFWADGTPAAADGIQDAWATILKRGGSLEENITVWIFKERGGETLLFQ